MIWESTIAVCLVCLAVGFLRVVCSDWSHFNLTVKMGRVLKAELSADRPDDE
jgi:hypothetical protein